ILHPIKIVDMICLLFMIRLIKKRGYFYHQCAHDKAQDQTQIILPDKPDEIGPIANINHYISKQPINTNKKFFLHPLKNYSGILF
ncbi:13693_t:CDS:1, partial [Gigaspora margarita]